jgi:hypothetical protein
MSILLLDKTFKRKKIKLLKIWRQANKSLKVESFKVSFLDGIEEEYVFLENA